MNPLRAVVVDDEPLAREGLVELLERLPELTIVGAFVDGMSALIGLHQLEVDVLFVDIQMPGMSGFDLIEALSGGPLPLVVFVTAFDAHAIRAFEVNALDYLLKPVSPERLGQAVERVRAQRRDQDAASAQSRISALLEGLPGRPRGVGRLIVREVGQVIVVPSREVDWIEGADYYALLHVGSTAHLLRETLTSLERRLDPDRFIRIHRSTIVNLSRVRAVEAALRGDGVVVLTSGARLKVMRSRRDLLERKLEALHDGGEL
ncbi:MAG: LytTR family DNA-binding domain-containing protein [Gemmatimonadota bacterium]